jgi:hypothetical protein
MSINGCLKQIATKTLALLKRTPFLTCALFDTKWLPESPVWNKPFFWSGDGAERAKQEARLRFGRLPGGYNQRLGNYDWEDLERQFLAEWEIPELNLTRYWQPLTYLLSGYLPGETLIWIVQDLEGYKGDENKEFLPFLVVEESRWDGLPLINAFGGGTELDYETSYGPVRYLLLHEVEQVSESLNRLSLQGFQNRCQQDAKQTNLSWVVN